ncbi:MAG: right-handed parallel beta-helix repeat-containing protein [Prosthecobacter sp.]
MKIHAILLLLAATTAHAVDYTYDALGRLRAESFSNNAHILHTYDAAGNRTRREVIPPNATPNADLVTTLTLTPDPAAQGLPVTATITVQNLGPDPAPDVQVSSALPAAFIPNSATATQGSAALSGQNLAASLGTIPSGETATITVQGIADGTANFIAEATTTSPADSTPGNNTGSDNTTPNASADLVLLRLHSGPQPLLSTGTAILAFTARNEGPATATGIEAEVVLPAGLTFTGAFGGTGSSTAGQTVTVTLADLVPDSETTIFVLATPTAAGDLTTSVALSADQADPDSANNSGSVVSNVLAPTLTVTNTNDSGSGSLRQALLDANANPDADRIAFAIPGGVVPTIAPTSPLPEITEPVLIDGWSQPQFAVEINGAGQGALTDVIVVRSSDVTLRALSINRGPRDGILITGPDTANAVENVQLFACNVGVDPAGTVDLGNGGDGIQITFANKVTIGGPETWQACIISGNTADGINIQSGSGHVIQNNRIGCDTNGATAIFNGSEGINYSAANGLIGGTEFGEGNLISGNREEGIQLAGSSTKVFGNLIGTDFSGTAPLPNGTGFTANSQAGIVAGGFNNQIGGPEFAQRNIISGNNVENVRMQNRCLVVGNYIGLDITGTAAVGGVDPNAVGVRFNFSSVTSPCVLGSPLPGHANIISGNPSHGVTYNSAGVRGSLVVGNRIGTSPDGKTAIANGGDGIRGSSTQVEGNTIGGSLPGAGNLIAGNTASGIHLLRAGSSPARNYTVQGNRIGVNIDGDPLGNGTHGIHLDSAQDNTIGGIDPGAGNLIANNTADGVSVTLSTGGTVPPSINNRISGNSIRNNGGLGIDLNDDGITANDAMDIDSGPNNFQNFPAVTLAEATGGSLIGAFNSTPNTTFHVEFFSNSAADPSGNGEGETFLGHIDLTTDGNGDADFALMSPIAMTAGHFVSVTATDPDGNTSEFGPALTIAPGFTFVDTDGDGMSDDYELNNFGTITGGNPLLDNDFDGKTNLFEFISLTSSKDPTSFFSAEPGKDASGFTVRFKSEVGRLYRLFISSNLTSFDPFGAEVAGTGGFITFTDTAPPNDRRFYQIQVRLAQ